MLRGTAGGGEGERDGERDRERERDRAQQTESARAARARARTHTRALTHAQGEPTGESLCPTPAAAPSRRARAHSPLHAASLLPSRPPARQRGAIALALAVQVPGSEGPRIVAATVAVVLVTIFGFGGSTRSVLGALKIAINAPAYDAASAQLSRSEQSLHEHARAIDSFIHDLVVDLDVPEPDALPEEEGDKYGGQRDARGHEEEAGVRTVVVAHTQARPLTAEDAASREPFVQRVKVRKARPGAHAGRGAPAPAPARTQPAHLSVRPCVRLHVPPTRVSRARPTDARREDWPAARVRLGLLTRSRASHALQARASEESTERARLPARSDRSVRRALRLSVRSLG